MKGKFIRLSVFGFILQVTSLIHAAPTLSGNYLFAKETTVNTKPQFEISLGAVFLQPTGTDLDYAILGFPLPVQSPHWDIGTVNPDYTAGFNLGLRYIFQNAENDIQLNWTHVATSDSDTTIAGNNQFAVPLFQAGPSLGQTINNAMQQAHATAKFNYDVVNLNAGQYINVGRRTQLRFYAGLSGTEIKETLDSSYQDNAATFNLNYNNTSKFTGIGPLFGMDGLYKLPYNLGVTGTIAISGLIGSLHGSTDYVERSPQLAASGITNNYQSISPKNSTQVVPSIDGKLGMNYGYLFSNNFIFTIEAGYEYATYFNAIVTNNPVTVVGEVDLGTIALDSLGKSVSNFSVNGPFVNASIRIT